MFAVIAYRISGYSGTDELITWAELAAAVSTPAVWAVGQMQGWTETRCCRAEAARREIRKVKS
jgi:hypothetical protein